MKIETGFGVSIEIDEENKKVNVRNGLVNHEIIATEDCLAFRNCGYSREEIRDFEERGKIPAGMLKEIFGVGS